MECVHGLDTASLLRRKKTYVLFSCWSRLKTCFISSSSMNCIYNCSVSHFLMFQYIEMDCGLTSDTFSPLFSDYVDSLPSGDPCFNMTDPDQQMCLGYLGPLYQDNPISAETACQWVFHWIADLMILVPLCHQTLLSHNCVCNEYLVFVFIFLSFLGTLLVYCCLCLLPRLVHVCVQFIVH